MGGGAPCNLFSRRPYRGINSLALGLAGSTPHWATWHQIHQHGGRVRRGARSVPILLWKEHLVWCEETDPRTGLAVRVPRKVPFARCHAVFNACDTEGLEEHAPASVQRAFEPDAAAEALLASIQPEPVMRFGGSRAFFHIGEDFIQMPEAGSFESPAHSYSTRFHELVHWSGHRTRLDRDTLAQAAPFGSPVYSQEELVAEMGAGFLCALTGVENAATQGNSAAYVASWLEQLSNDPRRVVQAASQAQRAVDYLVQRWQPAVGP